MSWRIRSIPGAILCALLITCSTTTALAADCSGDAVPGEFLVKLRDKVGATSQQALGLRISRAMNSLGADEVINHYDSLVPGLIHIRANGVNSQSLRSLANDDIEYIEPNRCIHLNDQVSASRHSSAAAALGDDSVSIRATPNDTSFNQLWGLHNTGQSGGVADIDIDGPEAWNLTTGSSTVVVGVVDTGVQANHPDLAANMWVNPGEIAGNGIDDDANGVIDDINGYNAEGGNGNPDDDNGHGSHCAGTIGAVGNNSRGVTGVNWNVRIMALKFLDSSGSGSLSDAIATMQYAVMMKNRGVNIRVLSNSWGGGAPTNSLRNAIQATANAGIVFVAAAGNESNNNDTNPSSPGNVRLPNVLSVAALDRRGALASFSNYGRTTVDLAAPGVDILSTVPTSTYDTYSGTSMACPHVSGVAALVAAREPTLSAAEIRTRLLTTVKPLANLQNLMVSPGIVSAFNALAAARGGECTPSDAEAPDRPSGDSDGDGVIDSQETTDGTATNDSGSYRVRLASPAFAVWTGFLEIKQYLELVNTGDTDVVADVSLYSIAGALLSRTRYDVFAREQKDVDVNALGGFAANSYGILKITYCGGSLDGRVSFYRPTAGDPNGNHDFVYTSSLSNPQYGASAVSFNTYQPSVAAGQLQDLVANWLSIINLSTVSQGFTVAKYGFDGTLISAAHVDVSPRARQDLEAGHENPGPNNVGLIVVTPDNPNAPYLAHLTRFGYNAPPGQAATGLRFAFPLVAYAPTSRPIVATITSTVGAQNWLEVTNPSSTVSQFVLSVRRQSGQEVGQFSVGLSPFSQQHFDMNALLGANEVGYAEITPIGSSKVLAQSMVYIRSTSGSISAMYGTHAREAQLSVLNGSFNLFLGMYNWMKITNPSDSTLSATVSVYTAGGVVNRTYDVPARGSRDLGIHESATFGTAPNTFGPLGVSYAGGRKALVELLRLRVDPATGAIDFATPTAVR